MRYLPLTLPTPAENIALDEALLEAAESLGDASRCDGQTLRVWQSPRPVVVVGRSSRLAEEVNLAECQRQGVPVLRRASGGAAIVAGPGCLMYAVVLDLSQRPELAAVDQAHAFVLGRVLDAAKSVADGVARAGTSDLVLSASPSDSAPARKFSGNSLRLKRNWLLYHGTLLYDFDVSLAGALLGTPPRQPDYRQQRDHGEFIANLPCTREQLEQALARVWMVDEPTDSYPRELVDKLLVERYKTDQWNRSR